jgi:branched-chain amino acid aminotransferase
MTDWVSIDGALSPAAEARIPVLDDGFTLGDAVYETLRTYAGRPFHLDLHLKRLRASAGRIGIEISLGDAELADRIDALLARAGHDDSYLRLIVSRGVGSISYRFENLPPPTVVLFARRFEEHPASHHDPGIPVAIVSVRRNPTSAADPAIKSCSLLNSVLAAREAHARGAVEAILLNLRGEVAEGHASNVFAVKHGALLTPPLDAGILAGITRGLVLRLARERGTTAREETLLPDVLRGADEVFVTSSVREVMPVSRIDDRPVGSGRPGPVTVALRDALRAYAALHAR